MSLLHLPLADIQQTHIDALVEDAVPESKTLEYKEIVPQLNNEEEKCEFCFDVIAFANAIGGDIIFGIREKRGQNKGQTGAPDQAIGLQSFNFDGEKRRLQQVIGSKVRPLIHGIDFRNVNAPNGPFMIMRVPRSWNAPHFVVKNDQWLRCYVRGNGTNGSPLDANEVRHAVLRAESLPQRISEIRRERLDVIRRDHSPLWILGRDIPPHKIVIQLISVPMMEGGTTLNADFEFLSNLECPPWTPENWLNTSFESRYNLEGFVRVKKQVEDQGYHSYTRRTAYVQMFRWGMIEATAVLGVDGQMLPRRFGESMANYIKQMLVSFQARGFAAPIFVAISLLGVSELRLRVQPKSEISPTDPAGDTQRFDVLDIILPEVSIENVSADGIEMIRPALDALWQAGGWERYFEP